MLSFKKWLKEEVLKKKRKKNGEQYSNQGAGKIRDDNHQGQADRANQEVQSNNIHIFPEP